MYTSKQTRVTKSLFLRLYLPVLLKKLFNISHTHFLFFVENIFNCSLEPTASPTTTSTSRPSTTQSPAGVFVCPQGAAGNFADPSNCQKFYKCFYGVATSESCAAGLLWDDSIKICNWAANVVCNSGEQFPLCSV